jgi:ABC-type Zn uptake system ZnuABC Zn-binding protein ZnuA
MGLDMYLRKKIYIGANFEHNEIAGVIYLTKGGTPIKINLDKVTYIIEDCGDWRKANQIHAWFVENVQEGKDDCREYYVSEEKLKELLDLCLQIKGNPTLAPELLPTQGGFFFGDTDYDEWYWYDIDNTISIIENVLNDTVEIDGKKYLRGDINYSSSW